jgi:hypothetical protein
MLMCRKKEASKMGEKIENERREDKLNSYG